MSKTRSGLRQEDHDPQQLRKVLDAAKRNDLASFIQHAARDRNLRHRPRLAVWPGFRQCKHWQQAVAP
jgi:hypothetical protein